MTQNQTDKKTTSLRTIIAIVVLAIAIRLGMFVLCNLGMQAVGGIYLGYLMSSGSGTVLHSDSNLDKTITIHVVSDDCGATCDCSTRLDIEFTEKTVTDAYRIHDACDVQIKWLDQYQFEVIDQEDKVTTLDVRDFQNAP